MKMTLRGIMYFVICCGAIGIAAILLSNNAHAGGYKPMQGASNNAYGGNAYQSQHSSSRATSKSFSGAHSSSGGNSISVHEDGDDWSALTAPDLPAVYSNGECPNTSGSASGGSQYFVFGFAIQSPNKRCHDREDVLLCYHVLEKYGRYQTPEQLAVLKGRCFRSVLAVEGLNH